MRERVTKLIPLICSLILTVGVMTVFRACNAMEDGSWMHCHQAQMGVFYVGLVLVAVSVVPFFLKNKTGSLAFRIAGIFLAILVMLVPNTIVSMCMMKNMRCHSVLTPFVMVMGVLIIITEVIDLICMIVSQRKAAE